MISSSFLTHFNFSFRFPQQFFFYFLGTYGPVAVAFNAKLIKLYGGGIFNDTHCDDDLTYAGLVVGYGSKEGIDYWSIKLSFGEKFGDEGYFYLVRNQQRQCGIGLVNLIPVIL